MREVAVIGVGMTKFGKYRDSSIEELGRKAALEAVKDAGIDRRLIQVGSCGNARADVWGKGYSGMAGQRILKEVGMTGIPIANIDNACASGSTAFRECYFAIGSGRYDIGIAIGVEKLTEVLVKKSLEFDYPRLQGGALRRIHGYRHRDFVI